MEAGDAYTEKFEKFSLGCMQHVIYGRAGFEYVKANFPPGL